MPVLASLQAALYLFTEVTSDQLTACCCVLADTLVSLQVQVPGMSQPAEMSQTPSQSHLAIRHDSVQMLHSIPKWDNHLGLAASFIMRPCCR